MGLFKKFFSISSKKSKKQSPVDPCTESLPPVQEHLKPCNDDGTEAEVSRLLRSSSGRLAAASQIGLGSLPPLRKFTRNCLLLLVNRDVYLLSAPHRLGHSSSKVLVYNRCQCFCS